MRSLSSTLSVGLALFGMLTSIAGVMASEFKPVLIGFVLLAGSAVFALLHIGFRPISARAGGSIDESLVQEFEN
jgi:hypothetical protein